MPTEEQWGLLVRKDSLLANKESIQPQDLVEVPLILPDGNFQSNRVRNGLANILIKFKLLQLVIFNIMKYY